MTQTVSNTLGTTSKIGLWCSKCGDLTHVFASDPHSANFTYIFASDPHSANFTYIFASDPRFANFTYIFASDPRFANFTQVGVMVVGQCGTPWVTATDATGVMAVYNTYQRLL